MVLELDPDRRLALAYVPTRCRVAVEALWRLDLAMASVLSTGREPMISRIRLAWWREALERLDSTRAPSEPVLEALEQHVLPLGVSGGELSEMEAGWAVLLEPDQLGTEQLDRYAAGRGGLLFGFTARLLGAEPSGVERGGESWALIDLARHSADHVDSEAARSAAIGRGRDHPRRWPSSLRPIGMLAMLAARDAERGAPWDEPGSPRRMLRMLRHRLTGG